MYGYFYFVVEPNALRSGKITNNFSQVISKKLVTFHDIQELQQNNEKLLNVVRDLSEDYEKAEQKLKECNKEEMEVGFSYFFGFGFSFITGRIFSESRAIYRRRK